MKAQSEDEFVDIFVCIRLTARGSHGNQVVYPHKEKTEIAREKRRSEIQARTRCSLDVGGTAPSFIGMRRRSPRRSKAPRQRPRWRRPPRLTLSGLPCVTTHSLPCYESPVRLASPQRLSLPPCSAPITACCSPVLLGGAFAVGCHPRKDPLS